MASDIERQNSEAMHIACAADEKYIAHSATMLHSLWWNNRETRLIVHFLHAPEFPQLARDGLQGMIDELGMELRWVEVPNEWLEGLSGQGYIPPVVWYRVFMPQLMPEVTRVIYLDSDIVITDSLLPMWQTDLGEHYFAAVTNAVPEYFAERAVELGMPGPEQYFNAGVAIWNLDALRRIDFAPRVLAYWTAHQNDLLWLEQDILNVLYHDRRLHLHPRWNCQNGIFFESWGTSLFDAGQVEEAVKSPAIVHFEGGGWAKPWHYLSPHPLRHLYWFHRRHTPWPKRIPEGITPRNILKKYLPVRLRRYIRKVVSL